MLIQQILCAPHILYTLKLNKHSLLCFSGFSDEWYCRQKLEYSVFEASSILAHIKKKKCSLKVKETAFDFQRL